MPEIYDNRLGLEVTQLVAKRSPRSRDGRFYLTEIWGSCIAPLKNIVDPRVTEKSI